MLDKLQNFIDTLNNMLNYLIDKVNYLLKPYQEYTTDSKKITLSSDYVDIRYFKIIENKQSGMIDINMQCLTKTKLNTGVTYVAGVIASGLAPTAVTQVSASCLVDDVGVIQSVAYSGNNPDRPRYIVISPRTAIPANSYIYIRTSYSMGGVVTKIYSFLLNLIPKEVPSFC